MSCAAGKHEARLIIDGLNKLQGFACVTSNNNFWKTTCQFAVSERSQEGKQGLS